MDSLLGLLPEDSTTAVITVKSDNITSSRPEQKQASNPAAYDPSTVFILEFLSVLVLRDEETVKLLGRRVMDALQSVLRDAPDHHFLVVSRAAFYLLNLLRASYVSEPQTINHCFLFLAAG